MLLVSVSSTVLWRILETLGEIALISALCMFFKASRKTRALSYQFPFNWWFTLCLSLLTSSLFPCVCWNLISLCSVTKALKMNIQSRKCNWETILSSTHSSFHLISWYYYYCYTFCTVVAITSSPGILYRRGAGLSSYYEDAPSYLGRLNQSQF